MKKVIIGITGASGQIFGIRCLEKLRHIPDVEVHLIMSEWAKRTIPMETNWTVDRVEALADCVYDIRDQSACVASGSFGRHGMIVAPCSVKTLSAIANCYTENLLIRAADVTLKERKKLILAFRETPLHKGHIRIMDWAAEAGAIIAPPVPAMYNHPESIDDLINHAVYRYLDLLDIESPDAKRWNGLAECVRDGCACANPLSGGTCNV